MVCRGSCPRPRAHRRGCAAVIPTAHGAEAVRSHASPVASGCLRVCQGSKGLGAWRGAARPGGDPGSPAARPFQRRPSCPRRAHSSATYGLPQGHDLPSRSNPTAKPADPREAGGKAEGAGRWCERRPLSLTPVPTSAETADTGPSASLLDTCRHAFMLQHHGLGLWCHTSGMFPTSRQCHLRKNPPEVFFLI